MQYRILILFFSFFVFSTISMAEETKKTTEKKVEEKAKVEKKPKPKETISKKKVENKAKANEKIVYYSQVDEPVILGKEDYQKVYKSLKGITAVYIDLDGYLKNTEKREMKIHFDLKKKIASILKTQGVELVDKEEIKTVYGQPTMKLTPLFPGFLGPYKKGEARKTYNKECCKGMFLASLNEGAKLLRYPDINLELSTWKTMQMTDDCSSLDRWFPEALVKIVEKFVKDKAKADKEKTPKKKVVKKEVIKQPIEETKVVEKAIVQKQEQVVMTRPRTYSTPTQQVEFAPVVTQSDLVGEEQFYRKVVTYQRVFPQQPVNYEVVVPQKTIVFQESSHTAVCDRVITMKMEIFRTGSSIIDTSKEFMLDTLVNRMMTCQTHRYVIETHADQRGSHAYNDTLTKDRAMSISNYLQRKGISSSRFITQSFGKRKPINLGTTAKDYSENRRVVVTPHKINR